MNSLSNNSIKMLLGLFKQYLKDCELDRGPGLGDRSKSMEKGLCFYSLYYFSSTIGYTLIDDLRDCMTLAGIKGPWRNDPSDPDNYLDRKMGPTPIRIAFVEAAIEYLEPTI